MALPPLCSRWLAHMEQPLVEHVRQCKILHMTGASWRRKPHCPTAGQTTIHSYLRPYLTRLIHIWRYFSIVPSGCRRRDELLHSLRKSRMRSPMPVMSSPATAFPGTHSFLAMNRMWPNGKSSLVQRRRKKSSQESCSSAERPAGLKNWLFCWSPKHPPAASTGSSSKMP